jgi:hypothetical protein
VIRAPLAKGVAHEPYCGDNGEAVVINSRQMDDSDLMRPKGVMRSDEIMNFSRQDTSDLMRSERVMRSDEIMNFSRQMDASDLMRSERVMRPKGVMQSDEIMNLNESIDTIDNSALGHCRKPHAQQFTTVRIQDTNCYSHFPGNISMRYLAT